MEIRQAKMSDVAKLSSLIREVISATDYYSPKAKKEEIKKHNAKALKEMLTQEGYYYCMVALEGKALVGFSIGRNEAGVFWGDWVGVNKNYRRRGIAEMILKQRSKILKSKGIHKIWADTRTNNKESIPLLKKLGYKKLGVFKNGWYKQDFFLWEKDI